MDGTIWSDEDRAREAFGDFKSERRILVDGDIVAWQASSTAEGRTYKIGSGSFKYKKDAVSFANTEGLNEADIKLEFHPEPVANALHTAKLILNSIRDEFPDAELDVFLSGDHNFRDSLSPVYKKNREGGHTPTHLLAVKQYLRSKYEAKIVDEFEADDLIGIEATKLGHKAIIATLDKDLNMIPGLHYNWRTQEKKTISERQALLFFYKQLLTGDRTDNISGLHGVGPKTAEKILSPYERDGSEYQMYLAVEKEWFNRKNERSKETILAELHTAASLLWIIREPYQIWRVPNEEEGNLQIEVGGKSSIEAEAA